MKMKNKSSSTLNAAQTLINNQLNTASIHCSYYSVLQYMKYILAHVKDNPIPYEQQNEIGKDSHEYLIQELTNRIQKPREKKNISEKIRDLKQKRVSADYLDVTYTSEEAIECKEQAEGLKTNFKTNFGNI